MTCTLANLATTLDFTDRGAFILLHLITESMRFDAIEKTRLSPAREILDASEKPLSSLKTTNPSWTVAFKRSVADQLC